MKRGQETNHILKQEAGTQDTHKTPLTIYPKKLWFTVILEQLRGIVRLVAGLLLL